jgi:hypothetical protein
MHHRHGAKQKSGIDRRWQAKGLDRFDCDLVPIGDDIGGSG